MMRKSFVGVIFVSLSDSSSAPDPSQLSSDLLPVLGDILALFSAFMYAVYMIFLKVRIRKEERIDMQLFFGFVGLFDVVCCWPIGLVLHLTGIERFELPSTRDTVIAILANVRCHATSTGWIIEAHRVDVHHPLE